MAKHPSKPGVPVARDDDPDLGSGRHRSCGPARTALARTEQLRQLIDDHVDADAEKLGEISRDVDDVRAEVRSISTHVGNLRVDVAKTLSAVDTIRAELADQNQIKHVTMIAEVETSKAHKIATIEDTTDARKTRRAFWLKVGLAAIAGIGYLLGLLIERYL